MTAEPVAGAGAVIGSGEHRGLGRRVSRPRTSSPLLT